MRSLSIAAGLIASTLVAAAGHASADQTAFSLPPQQHSPTSSTPSASSFAGQRVIRYSTSSSSQHKQLISQAHRLGLDVWAAKIGSEACGAAGFGCVDVRMAADTHNEDPSAFSAKADELMGQLMQPFARDTQPSGRTLIEDVGALISEEQREPAARTEAAMRGGQEWHRDYHSFEEIEAYMRMLEQSYAGYVQLVELGRTHENRPIWGIKISQDVSAPTNATAHNKLGIVITGGQHAREWISTSAALHFASDLLHAALGPPSNTTAPIESSKSKKRRKKQNWTQASARSILSTFTLTVIPIVNPDGYAYTWTHNRMWRKNRQPNPLPSGLWCKGVDLNRNWDYAFSGGGRACSEMYAGEAAWSAAETRAVAEFVGREEERVHGWFDLHSYGQLLMYPFSHSCDQSVADEEDLLELSLGAISALKRSHGKAFTAGKVCSVYAEAGGSSVDWSYAGNKVGGEEKARVKWSFSVELRDGGTYGFLLPRQQIVPASEEVGAALAYMLQFVARKER